MEMMCGCVREADSVLSISFEKIFAGLLAWKIVEELMTHEQGEAEKEIDETEHHEHSRYEVERYVLGCEYKRDESQPQISDAHRAFRRTHLSDSRQWDTAYLKFCV